MVVNRAISRAAMVMIMVRAIRTGPPSDVVVLHRLEGTPYKRDP